MNKYILFLILFFSNVSVYAFCEAILENGIYDTRYLQNDLDQFSTAQSVHCDKRVSEVDKDTDGSGKIGYGDFTIDGGGSKSQRKKDSAEFCKMDFNQYMSSGKFRNAVETINQGIVKAWVECRNKNVNNVLHYITPSEDPNVFTYKIQFNRDPDTVSKAIPLTNWDILGGSCRTSISAGTLVTHSGTSSICTRESEEKTVTIIADVELFGKYLKGIELKGVREDERDIPPVPCHLLTPNHQGYVKCLVDYIHGGNVFTITLDPRPGDSSCGDRNAHSTTWQGNFIAGQTYRVFYVPGNSTWITEGPMQGKPGCGLFSNPPNSYALKFDPNNAKMNLWQGIFTFDKQGVVYRVGQGRVGKINYPF